MGWQLAFFVGDLVSKFHSLLLVVTLQQIILTKLPTLFITIGIYSRFLPDALHCLCHQARWFVLYGRDGRGNVGNGWETARGFALTLL